MMKEPLVEDRIWQKPAVVALSSAKRSKGSGAVGDEATSTGTAGGPYS